MTLKQMRILTLSMVLSWTAFTIGFYILSGYDDNIMNSVRPKIIVNNNNPKILKSVASENHQQPHDKLSLIQQSHLTDRKLSNLQSKSRSKSKQSINNRSKNVINIGVLLIACNRTLLAKSSVEQLLNLRELTREKFLQRFHKIYDNVNNNKKTSDNKSMKNKKMKKNNNDAVKSLYINKTYDIINAAMMNDLNQMLRLPIVVSQDCGHVMTNRVLSQYVHGDVQNEKMKMVENVQNVKIPTPINTNEELLLEDGIQELMEYPESNRQVPNLTKIQRKLEGYYRIARHYRWAIDQTFKREPTLDMLILVEDDLQFSLDFFEYFLTLAPLLRDDPTLYCISAWNDNGKPVLIDSEQSSLLYRTDFFPGLGWMLSRELWEKELRERWPVAFWDDWLREPEQRRNRQCIRPELSRTSTVGKKGVSNGQYYQQHLAYIRHSNGYYEFYEYREKILQSLMVANHTADVVRKVKLNVNKKNQKKTSQQTSLPQQQQQPAQTYEQRFLKIAYHESVDVGHPIRLKTIAERTTLMNQWQKSGKNKNPKNAKAWWQLSPKHLLPPPASLRLIYHTRNEFITYSTMLGLMSDLKNGVPRTAYLGIVSCFYRGYRIYLAPPETRVLYLQDWI